VRGFSKSFGGAQALTAVDLDIHRGEVHGLVGANGAGKSTLIRMLAGIVLPDAGELLIDGNVVTINNPSDAESFGLAFIHQELALVPHFTAVQNMLLGSKKSSRAGLINWKKSSYAAYAAAEKIGIQFPLDKRVDELSVAEQWLVMISKALVGNASMIAMDEPTASLSGVESEKLFKVIKELANDGVTVLYVSHRLDEVLNLSDRITVFRDGRVADQVTRGQLDKAGLIRAIVGRELVNQSRAAAVEVDKASIPLFEAVNVSRGKKVQNVSLKLYKNEILGLGGLIGAGRTEFARLAFGAEPLDSGIFKFNGEEIAIKSIVDAVKKGVGLIPEERRLEGLMLEKSVIFNMNLGILKFLRQIPSLPFLNFSRSRIRAQEMIKQLSIKVSDLDEPISGLSGGNQQKVLIARWLTPEVKLLILDEPSRGVDVGAREEIHQTIRNLANSGVGTIVISSDVEELAALCDRILVMCEGRIHGEVSGTEISEKRIIELSYSHPVITKGEKYEVD